MAVEWPEWWEWELEIIPHLEKRMGDRGFTDIDLRAMLAHASGYAPHELFEGRWVINTKHRRAPWKVIVEPDRDRRLLVVVTAYPVRGD